MSSIWLRYPSGGNANHRANAVEVLCSDYLSRLIVLTFDQLIEDPETGISSNASCQSCHSTLDPLSAFFGWFSYEDDDGFGELRRERTGLDAVRWRRGLHGTPTAGLTERGPLYRPPLCRLRGPDRVGRLDYG